MPFCDPALIKVPSNRFRPADPAEVDEMIKSFKEVGQLQPVLVDSEMNLTAGLHRLETCRKMQREVWYETEEAGRLMLKNPLLKRMAEYQENFRRKDFTPIEKSKAIAEIDRIMREMHGDKRTGPGIAEGWTMEDTAKKLGHKSHRIVSEAIQVTTAIKTGAVPGLENAKTMQEAVKMVKDTARLEAAKLLAERRGPTAEISNPMEFFGNKIILGDCLEKLQELQSGICSFFITDPPWKIEADRTVAEEGSVVQRMASSYDDSSDSIIPLVKSVVTEMYRVAKPDCYVVMFCGAKHWLNLTEHFRETGFQVYGKPLVWVKTGPVNGLCSSKSPVPSIWPASVTDFMLLARKGSAVLAQLHKGDAFLCPPTTTLDRIHQAQKPILLMEEIISRFYHPGTNPLLIDPFVGSGSTLVAAQRLGIRNYFGYELSKENRERAVAFLVNQYVKDQEGGSPVTTIDLEEYD